jgi:hypothetical protein
LTSSSFYHNDISSGSTKGEISFDSCLLPTLFALENQIKVTVKYRLGDSDTLGVKNFERCSRAMHPMNQLLENEEICGDEITSTDSTAIRNVMNKHVVKFRLHSFGRYISSNACDILIYDNVRLIITFIVQHIVESVRALVSPQLRSGRSLRVQ